MNLEEYTALVGLRKDTIRLHGRDLTDKTPRTLMYGYNCHRDTFHVYLGGEVIHLVYYTFQGSLIQHMMEDFIQLDEYVPDKRLYPETCDLEFCRILKHHGVNLPFTYFNETRLASLWYGKRFEELK